MKLLPLLLFLLLMAYTDALLQSLLTCSKDILNNPKGMKLERGQYKDTFTMVSTDGAYSYRCYIRQSATFSENFSIGLDYNPRGEKGTIKLIRCNGKHGGIIEQPHHAYCHIHKAVADSINNGLDHLCVIDITTDYSTLEESIQYFMKLVNLNNEDRNKYFPRPNGQISLELT